MGTSKNTPSMVANGVTATGLAWGPNKVHVVEPLAKRTRQSEKKGKLGTKVKFARDVIREVAGFTPYEKRAIKFCKKRLGTHRRGKKKRAELEGVLQAQK